MNTKNRTKSPIITNTDITNADITNEKGTALVVSLLMLVIMTTIGITATSRTIVEGWLSANYRSATQAFYIAEAGLERTRNDLRNDTNWSDNTTAPGGTINVGGRQATYTITTRDRTHNSIIITSTGVIAGAESIVEARIERLTIPAPPAAVYLGGSPVTTNFAGNAFEITGNDTNLDGRPGPALSVWGIAINTGATITDIPKNRRDNIIGKGAPPSIGTTPPINLDALAEQYIGIANQLSGNQHIEDKTTWGTLTNPQVTYVKGDLKMSGKSSGAGVLIVGGNLTMKGTPRWDGIIIVLGNVSSQAGTPDIFGALLIRGNELDVRGNVNIQYSSQAIAMANTIAPVRVSSWRQVHN